MSPKLARQDLTDGSFLERSNDSITPDKWRPHGVKYRYAWIQKGHEKPRVLFDNHHGKNDHFHIDETEFPYNFESIEKLLEDFLSEIRKLGGPV